MKSKVNITNAQQKLPFDKRLRFITTKAVDKTLEMENISFPCEVDIKIVTDAAMKKLNTTFRDVKSTTDVLSFPSGEFKKNKKNLEEPCFLGDIAISLEFAKKQAEDGGRSLEHDLILLMAHSVLHLLGYDHDTKKKEKEMFEKQENIVLEVEKDSVFSL